MGCGMSRAFIALSHGHLRDAVRFHRVSPIVYLLVWFLLATRIKYLVQVLECKPHAVKLD
jgi:hypothetical protein